MITKTKYMSINRKFDRFLLSKDNKINDDNNRRAPIQYTNNKQRRPVRTWHERLH